MNLKPNPRICELAAELKLAYTRQNWHELASDTSLTHEEYLLELLTGEYENRLNNGIARRTKEAKFPYKKYLVDFDKTKYSEEFLPEFAELETLDFINKNENIILIGTPGAGKTHYSIALGIAACMAGESVFFANVSNLVIELKEAMNNLQISRFRQKFERYSLVILDELGYVTFDKSSAELLFSLISSRNDKGSIIVTSNLTFDRWEEVFHDPTLTAAAVDRLAHKGHILDISREKGGRFEETMAWLNNKSSSNF
ncbi:MAG: IS21-like element helper ATPase IstB [Oscillospiraceae bacterium]|jgi:DNA replication protein DnaC|nr:IS21-like element helper ATPase IstB [Oscillospiraceae bacterium]